ncbi:hypothetical protein G6F35_014792 [Rhizopus arrhizus]|nr:hypothetical protein G6F35_014792 [Rhizopus arrhizus]
MAIATGGRSLLDGPAVFAQALFGVAHALLVQVVEHRATVLLGEMAAQRARAHAGQLRQFEQAVGVAGIIVQVGAHALQALALSRAQRAHVVGLQILGLQADGQQLQGHALAPQRIDAVLPGAVEQLAQHRQQGVRNRPVAALQVGVERSM